MSNFKRIFTEAFYGPETKNAVVEFAYPQLKQLDIDKVMTQFTDLLKQIGVEYSNNYNNISKIMVICGSDKVDEVKDIGTSLGLSFNNQLLPDSDETSHL
jgi:hypothetical protein